MLARRELIIGALAAAVSVRPAVAHQKRDRIDPIYLPQIVQFARGYKAGTLVVEPRTRFLYLVEAPETARRYGIGVGRAGRGWSGWRVVGRKAEWPSWRPTDNMVRREPKKYARFAGGVPGGPSNPLGARALYLYHDGQDTYYRIHGTNEPWSIGRAVSSGCFRLLNEHVTDLYERVAVGTPVHVTG